MPLLACVFLLNLLFLWHLKLPAKELRGSREFFRQTYAQFGPMKRGEKIALFLFVLATLLAFARPLFASVFPAMKPAYCFLFLGLLTFVLKDERGKTMLDWKYAESHAMWGMYFLFASGIALGQMLIQTGAVGRLAQSIAALELHGGFVTMLVFAAFTTLMAEISSNTAAASIAIPVVTSICEAMGLPPVPYVFTTIVAQSCAYVLPVSTRAIPVAFGLDTGIQIREGLKLTVLNVVLTAAACCACMHWLPYFPGCDRLAGKIHNSCRGKVVIMEGTTSILTEVRLMWTCGNRVCWPWAPPCCCRCLLRRRRPRFWRRSAPMLRGIARRKRWNCRGIP